MKLNIPEGFHQTESHLDGITVFAPAPVVQTETDSVEFKCPQCGATTSYNPSVSGISCQHCGYAKPTEGNTIGRAAEESEFTLENLSLSARGWGEDRAELHCESCGADLSIDINADKRLSTTCPFCASNRVTARINAQDSLRPRFLIPFKLQANKCLPLVKEWLGRGWMHPPELRRLSGSMQMRGVYLPFWTFDATISAEWKAEVGYERTERYYDSASKSWKTRTRIDWRWESGHLVNRPDDWLGYGSTKISHILLKKIEPFQLGQLNKYEPSFLAGWQALVYDIPLQEAWDSVKAEMREQTRQDCRRSINSHHVRNFSMLADFGDETWRYILLPVYVSAYKFGDEVFQVLVNGQTGLVSGQKPVAWWKIGLAGFGLLSPGLFLALIGGILLLFGGLGLLPLGIGLLLLIIGGVITAIILQQALSAGEV